MGGEVGSAVGAASLLVPGYSVNKPWAGTSVLELAVPQCLRVVAACSRFQESQAIAFS